MATIVTRTAKGSALTFAEGDANFTNLNDDKLENISEDTSPSLGGDLDLLGFDITDTTGNPSIGGFEYPKVSAGAAEGTVTFIDTDRNPNTITLTNGDNLGVVFNTRLRFTGTSVSGNGLEENEDYFVAATIGGNAFEISDTVDGSPITITGGGDFSDFNWSAPDLVASGATNGDVLVFDGTKFVVQAPAASGLTSVLQDTNPQLGGNLDVNDFNITSSNNGNVNISPNGDGNIQLTPATGLITLDYANWPNADGANGQVLTTDGTGDLSWQTAGGGAQPYVILRGSGNNQVSGTTKRASIVEVLDTDSICSLSDGDKRFTLPAGTYVTSIFPKAHSTGTATSSGSNFRLFNITTNNNIGNLHAYHEAANASTGQRVGIATVTTPLVFTLSQTTTIEYRGVVNNSGQIFFLTFGITKLS